MAGNQYYGSIPTIAKAYENDPRTKLAAAALQAGTSTAPVAQGGWGVTDGLARAAQAIVGAVVQKGQNAKYSDREQQYMQSMKGAAQMASAPQPMAAAATALGAPPVQAPAAAPGMPPQAPQMAPPATPLAAPPGMPPQAPQMAPMAGASMPMGNPLTPPGAMPVPMAGGTGPNRGAPSDVLPPKMEAVPNAPAAPSAQAPAAPALPAEVQSNRIAMAQKLIASGNPDLVEIAQTYLDKGLDEQNSARTLGAKEQFEQGQTGYKSALDDTNNARSDYRQNTYADRRDATGRNFKREETFGNQTFEAGESAKTRSFQAGQAAAQRAFERQQSLSSQGFQAGQNALERDTKLKIAGIRADGSRSRQDQRNAFFSTPTGLKMQQKAGEDINSNTEAIGKLQRFMDLNDRQKTGGLALNTPGVAAAYRWTNSDLTELNALANDTTLAKIGGSLGTAISDGDRKFITDSNIGVSNPKRANTNMARATIGALHRKNDYIMSFANAQADGTAQSFPREWSAFVESTPIVKRDANGNALRATDKPLTFEQWKASVPKYDQNGNKVK